MTEDKKEKQNTPDKKDSKNLFDNFKSDKGDGKKQKFNFYWIYGILAIIFIGTLFMDWDGSAKTMATNLLIKKAGKIRNGF